METDPKRVELLAQEREDENWRFRSFLKGVDLGIEELDEIVHGHLEAVAEQIDCRACGNCCRHVLPVLSPSEVTRLARGLGLTRDALVNRHLQPHREEGRLTFNARPCPLLTGTECSAYESRPDACRSFPHLHKPEFVFRLAGVVANCAICPIVFNVYERLKAEHWNELEDEWDDDSEWNDNIEDKAPRRGAPQGAPQRKA